MGSSNKSCFISQKHVKTIFWLKKSSCFATLQGEEMLMGEGDFLFLEMGLWKTYNGI
jgi:hypothetical protein